MKIFPKIFSLLFIIALLVSLDFLVSFGWTNPTSAPPVGFRPLNISVPGNVGIGLTNPLSKLGILGGVSLGSSYAASPAPANGLLVQDKVGIGTNAPEAALHVGTASLKIGSQASSGGGAVLWTAISSPFTTGVEKPTGAAMDSSGLYVVGNDSGGSNEWRIEKRNLTAGLLCDAANCGIAFGTNGVVTSNPSGRSDIAQAVTLDTAALYVVGHDGQPGTNNTRWRIEKRNLTTGSFITTFGTGSSGSTPASADGDGVITSNPTVNNDVALGTALDTTGLYVVGYDSPAAGDAEWRIEKRLLTTGALCDAVSCGTAFDGDGVVTNNYTVGVSDQALGIAADTSGLYVVGFDAVPGNDEWRIEKRNLTTGAFIAAFGLGGTDGDGVVTSNPSTGSDQPASIALDASGLYVVGYDSGASGGNNEWRIEKRYLDSGLLIPTFGFGGTDGDGVVTSNPSTGSDQARAIALDSTGIYIAGFEYDLAGDNIQWRIEKRDKNNGSLLWEMTEIPSSNADQIRAITIDSTGVYVAGFANPALNEEWRMEKISLGTNVFNGIVVDSSGKLGIGTTNPGAKVQVTGGDAYVDTVNRGLILKTPDGVNCYRLTVNDSGEVSAALVIPSCP